MKMSLEKLKRTLEIMKKQKGENFKFLIVPFTIKHQKFFWAITTDNPNVNLQDELCFFLNYVFTGHKPPDAFGIVEFKQPTGWKKLKPREWATPQQMERFLR